MNYLCNIMKHSITIVLLFFSFTSFAFSQEEKNKMINYPLYTFSIPSTWEPYRGDSSIKKRTTDKYLIEATVWNSPIKSISDIPNTITVSIYSYTRTDKKELSINDIKNHIMLLNDVSQKNIIEEKAISSTQKNMIIRKESKKMDGTPITYYRTYIIYKKVEVVHYVEISATEELYGKDKTKLLIKDIQESFSFK